MDFIISELPHTVFGWLGLLIGIVALGFLAYIFYNRNKDGADDRLIGILKETVEALEKKVDDQKKDHDDQVGQLTKKIDELTEKVEELDRENHTLVKVLQGRDEATLEFQKQMLEAVKIGMETNGLAKETSKRVADLIDIMSKHLVAVEKRQKEEHDDQA